METHLFAMAQSLGILCQSKKITIALAESCTGGMLSTQITAVPGSSYWFVGSVVAYSNSAKMRFLQVSEDMMKEHGAVSESTAVAMVNGLLQTLPAEVALSVTGIAGPTGGSAEKPVGQVCFALINQRRIHDAAAKTLHFSGGRQHIRFSACAFALQWLLDEVIGSD